MFMPVNHSPEVRKTQASIKKWMINKTRCIHTMEQYSAIKRNRAVTQQGEAWSHRAEINQTQRTGAVTHSLECSDGRAHGDRGRAEVSGCWGRGESGATASRAQNIHLGLQRTSEVVGRAARLPLNCTPKATTTAALLLVGILPGAHRSNLKSRQKLRCRLPATQERAGWGVSAWLSSGLPLGRKLLGLGRGSECRPTVTFQWLSLYYVSFTSIFKSTYKLNAKMIKETVNT